MGVDGPTGPSHVLRLCSRGHLSSRHPDWSSWLYLPTRLQNHAWCISASTESVMSVLDMQKRRAAVSSPGVVKSRACMVDEICE